MREEREDRQGGREAGRQGGREAGRQGGREAEEDLFVVGDGISAELYGFG